MGYCARRVPVPLISCALLIACSDSSGPGGVGSISLTQVASGLDDPLYLTAPAGDSRLFIVEQPGRARIIKNGSLLPTPFLDITGKVLSGGERGLLSVAFHPNY